LTVNDGELPSAVSMTTATVTDAAEAIGGEALFAENCAGCHGDPWAKPAYDDSLYGLRRLAGARECTITASIYGTSVFPNGVPEMQYLQGMFSEQDIADLATYLNSRDATGEQRYVTACAGCHGADGSGGRSHENVMGEDAHETREAIREERDMRFLACMPDLDIAAITSFLTDAEGDNDHDGIGDDDDDDDDNDGIKDDDDDDDDGDELSDEDEHHHHTNQSDHDSDNDGLDDGEEVHEHHTNPMDDDSDDDGLTDGEEVNEYGTDPNDEDSDDDGYSDGDEVKLMGTDPLVASSATTASTSSSGGGGALGWILLLGMLLGRFLPLASRKPQA
jgi:mono/diheme cytochrome c family protein